MPGRLRRKDIQNARHELTFKQAGFKGQSVDIPASELVNKVSGGITSERFARLENVICRDTYAEGVSGSERYSYARLPGTGVIYAEPKYNPSCNRWLFHRGTTLYLSDSTGTDWTAVTVVSTTIQGYYSTIEVFGQDFLVFSRNGLYYVHVLNKNYFKVNADCPFNGKSNEHRQFSWDYTLTVTVVAATDLFSIGAYIKNIPTGNIIKFTTTGTLPAPLEVDVMYYAIYQSSTTFKVALTYENAMNGLAVDITDTGSGVHTLVCGENYAYNYAFTFLRMLNKTTGATGVGTRKNTANKVFNETGTRRVYGTGTDYGTILNHFLIDDLSPKTIYLYDDVSFVAGDVDITNDVLITALEVETGNIIKFMTSGTLPSPLVVGTSYYAIKASEISATTNPQFKFKLAHTIEDALAGNAIDLSSTGDGSIYKYVNSGADAAFTHIGVYRSLNISTLTDNGYDPALNQGNNSEVLAWVTDVPIGDASFIDKTPDTTLRAKIPFVSDLCKARNLIPIPSGEVGAVSTGWLFASRRDAPDIEYCSIKEDMRRHIGFHDAMQYHSFDQNVTGLKVIENTLIVTCPSITKSITLTSYRNTGLLEFVPILDHFPDGDKSIGVMDWGTISDIDDSTVIAVCSDQSVRIWAGTRWGEDLTANLVKTEIKKMVLGSVARYYNGVYHIWYRTDSLKAFNDNCLRLAIKSEAGIGWSFRTGTKMVKPPLYVGATLLQDSIGQQRLIVIDDVDKYLYWIETFDGYTGSGLSKIYADKKIDGGFCTLNDKYWYDELDGEKFSVDLLDWSAP